MKLYIMCQLWGAATHRLFLTGGTVACLYSGGLRSGSSCESDLRQNVSVARQPLQQDSGDKEQATVFHRRPRHRRLRNFPGNFRVVEVLRD